MDNWSGRIAGLRPAGSGLQGGSAPTCREAVSASSAARSFSHSARASSPRARCPAICLAKAARFSCAPRRERRRRGRGANVRPSEAVLR